MKSSRLSNKTTAAKPRLKPPSPGVPGGLPVYVAVALVLLAGCAMLATWATPDPGAGDLFVALAGGRDVMAGKLGQPDDWSFTTAGRVWINQNWLAHLVIFLAWETAGTTGLLLLKAALISAMAGCVCLLSRRRGCTWYAAILLAAGATMSCSLFVDLRANLLTLVMVPLLMWVLDRSLEHRQRIWWAVPVLLAWANLHGGFVFGLGMVGLWAVCISLGDWYHDRLNPFRKYWPLWICAASCIAAAAISPFGLRNLTHPLVIASSPAWRSVNEWHPLMEAPLPMPWGFLAMLGLTVVLGIIQGLAGLPKVRATKPISGSIVRRTDSRAADNAAPSTSSGQSVAPGTPHTTPGPWLFTVLLSIIAVACAFCSWRLVGVASLVLTAPLASSLAWLTRRWGHKVLAGLTACVLVGVFFLARQNLLAYWPGNPVQRGTTIFDRMHGLPASFPVEAARFLADNHIRDNAFCDWAWEGYLRWVCPGVKVFIGGRAQQVYTEEILAAYNRLDEPVAGPDLLRQYQGHLAVLSAKEPGYIRMTGLLVTGKWACVYGDRDTMILADVQTNSYLVQQALAGQLTYPSESIRALSRALCLATVRPTPDKAEMFAAAKAANALQPARRAYVMAGSLGRDASLRPAVIQYLEQELSRLLRLQSTPQDFLMILQCRAAIQSALAELYGSEGRSDAARAARTQAGMLLRQAGSVEARWRYLPDPWQGKSSKRQQPGNPLSGGS